MGSVRHHRATATMVIESLPKGMVRKSQSLFEWDVSGRCQSPKLVVVHGRPAADWIQRHRYVIVRPRQKHSLIVELWTPCRKCRACLKSRMRMWTARAMHEVREANRTWFATFTLSPENHYAMQCRAVAHAEARSIPSTELTADELFARQSTEVEKELTLWLKRVRKEYPSQSIRYLLVRERHKSGLPHWHALIHESGEVPIRYAVLASNWKLGFAKIKLIENERAAFYVAKYLGKSNDGRVRASLRYGRFNSGRNTPSGIGEQSEAVECEELRSYPEKSHNNGEAESEVTNAKRLAFCLTK